MILARTRWLRPHAARGAVGRARRCGPMSERECRESGWAPPGRGRSREPRRLFREGRREPSLTRRSRTPVCTCPPSPASCAPGSKVGKGAGEDLGVPAGRGKRGTAVALGCFPERPASSPASLWCRGVVGVAVGSHILRSRSEPEMLTRASGPFRTV